jgi:hypothetical protein
VALVQCTFYGNESDNGAIYSYTSAGASSIANTIIAFSRSGAAFECGPSDIPELVCCDLWGNEGGDWDGCIADQYGLNGNICEDPLFCDPESGDFTLDCNSPCAAENDPDCGQIGAWPVGCGPTPVMETSWGAIKAMFRE